MHIAARKKKATDIRSRSRGADAAAGGAGERGSASVNYV